MRVRPALLFAIALAGAGATAPAAGDRAAAAAELLAAYAFDEPRGRAVLDASGNGKEARLSGVKRARAGRYGAALAFDGARGVVTSGRLGRAGDGRAMTLEAWVRPSAAAGRRRRGVVVAAVAGGLPAHALLIGRRGRGAGAVVRRAGSRHAVRTFAKRRLRGWAHLASTYDGRVLRAYLDGDLIARRRVRGSLTSSPMRLRIGGAGPDGGHFAGLVDDVRVYARALSGSEIRDDMRRATNAGPAPAPPSPDPRPAPAPSPLGAPPTVFVAVDGSDAGPCSREAPCRGLDRAYRVASPGETVEVAGGRYPSQMLLGKPGMAAPHVLIREAPGAQVVIGDAGETTECIGFEGAQYVTLEGFETPYTTVGGMSHQCGVSIGRSDARHVTLVNLDAGMLWVGADDVQVLGGDYGPGIDENTKIQFGSGHEPRDVLIDGAVIHDQRSYRQHPECVALWGGTRVTIRNSWLYNCGTFHIFLVANSNAISDVLIEGNTFTQPDPSVHTSNTIKVGDHGGVLNDIVIRGNRLPHDELYVLQGYGDGGTGDVHVFDNMVGEPIELGGGQDCMADATYRPKPAVTYECRGNRIIP